MSKKIKSILLNIPDEMFEAIKVGAKIKDMSVSAFLRWVIKKELVDRLGVMKNNYN